MKKYSRIILLAILFIGVAIPTLDKRIKIDILIHSGAILTMDESKTIYEVGSIAIKNDEIIDIGKDEELQKKYKARKKINAENKLVLPGLINTHTHAAMTLLRGYADDVPLKEWLEKYIWPAEAQYMNKETIVLGTKLAISEMIRSGTTTFCDMYFYSDAIAQVAKEAGIRVIVGEGILDFPTPSNKTPEAGLKYTEMLIKKWKDDPLVSVSVAPHSPYICSKEVLIKAKTLSDKYQVPLHIHVSETKKEVADMISVQELTPVAYLDKIGFLGDRVIAAHCVHLTSADIAILVKRNVGVAHNPESNLKLASGIAPISKLLKFGVKVGLGTDGAASNNDLNMFEEMDTAAKIHKGFLQDPTVLPAYTVLEMATIRGAKVLGLDKKIGSLETGKKADIIIIDLNKPHLVPLYNYVSPLVYSADGADVEIVIINGKIVMYKKQLLTLDENAVIQQVKEFAKAIQEN